ncbi:aspartate/glutamate racemase family protein, partial [Shinella sp.]|uniref:aspartate/glutamate racemase family protein n=1 Tax=Shinella sp. TaxID=1870904 RepID=UPI003F702D89
MKIGVLGSYGDTVPPEVLAVIGHGVTVAFYKPRVPAFAFSPAEFVIQELSYLEAGMRAAADGCEAIVYNSCSDYGIEALRAAVDVPVVGAGEAMLAIATQLGARFSIVTVWPVSTNFMPQALVRERRLEERLASIRNVSAEAIIESDGRPNAFIAGM